MKGNGGRRALITGVAGQDGSYLAELLLEKGYEVHGLLRESGSPTPRIDHLRNQKTLGDRFRLHVGDIADTPALISVVDLVQPDEVYNLAGETSRAASFDHPQETCETTAVGPIRLFEHLRALGERRGTSIRVCQAGSSEMFEPSLEPQNETSPFHPRSPYAACKLAVHFFGVGYRESYGCFISNAILFNHESPRRGEHFVTRKITRAVARIKCGLQRELVLGNLDARRDWGFAGDYVVAMWMMLQAGAADDFVIASGETHSVAEFCEAAFARAGLDWREYVRVDEKLYRTAELDRVTGDPAKAHSILGWRPEVQFDRLVEMLVDADLKEAQRELVSA